MKSLAQSINSLGVEVAENSASTFINGFNSVAQLPTSSEGIKHQSRAYLDLRDNFLTSELPKRKRKPKSERLEISYKTQDKLVKLLAEVGEGKTSKSMALCGRKFDALLCKEGHIAAKLPYHRCNVRYCPLCANRRAARYQRKYLPFALDFVRLTAFALTPCLLTLTQKKIKGERLVNSRERILNSFRKFIRHDFFEKHFSGGLFAFENTVSESGNHSHLHVVAFRRKYVSHELLKDHWAKVSPGAKNLNIKRLKDLESGLREAIKYVSKPVDVDTFEIEHLSELLEVKRKRMIDTFGGFRKFCLSHELPEVKKEERVKVEAGQCCSRCDATGVHNVLFQRSVTHRELIDLHRQNEKLRVDLMLSKTASETGYKRLE
jgi:hypothetical protein